jgi:hypothetical protein
MNNLTGKEISKTSIDACVRSYMKKNEKKPDATAR